MITIKLRSNFNDIDLYAQTFYETAGESLIKIFDLNADLVGPHDQNLRYRAKVTFTNKAKNAGSITVKTHKGLLRTISNRSFLFTYAPVDFQNNVFEITVKVPSVPDTPDKEICQLLGHSMVQEKENTFVFQWLRP